MGAKNHFKNGAIINQSMSDRRQTLSLKSIKKFFVAICTIVLIAAIGLVACNKDNQLPIQKSAETFNKQPYTYLQNKYMDLVIAYEFEKQAKEYNPEKFSYEEKLETILLLDSIKTEEETEETKDDILFHQKLERELMTEINNHHYLQKFIQNFALKENYDENDMIIYTGYSDCDDAISKFLILKYYENGIDINDLYLNRQTLTGDEEWSLPPTEPSFKAVRYILHAKWGKKIEYLWNAATSATKTGVVSAMREWESAANNKISFSEITKNVNWNKTCWIFGWKYFLRISSVNSGNFSGQSTLGNVPWAAMDFKGTANTRTFRHELGHALGLYHEHQRADRDNYITYYPNNVESGAGPQFSKMTAGSYNYYSSTFDFNSIMLYGSGHYSKNGNATLLKKDGSTFSAPTDISATDKNVIRQIYN